MLSILLKLLQNAQGDRHGQHKGKQVADGLAQFKARQAEDMGQKEHGRNQEKSLSGAATSVARPA